MQPEAAELRLPNDIPPDTPVQAVGPEFLRDLFGLLGLQMKGLLDASMDFDGGMVTLNATYVVTRQQAEDALAVLRQRNYRVYLERKGRTVQHVDPCEPQDEGA